MRSVRSTLFAPALGIGFLAALPPLALGTGSAPEDLWVHVTVEESDGEEARVRLNFPLRFAESLLPLITGGDIYQGPVRIDNNDSDIDADDLQTALKAVKEAREGQFLPIHPPRGHSGNEEVEAARVGDHLVIRAEDADSHAQIRLPMRVAEALVDAAADMDKGNSAEIEIAGILREMREIGPGELVTATDGDSHVRIWIDDEHESK